jgi:hypothetical protein
MVADIRRLTAMRDMVQRSTAMWGMGPRVMARRATEPLVMEQLVMEQQVMEQRATVVVAATMVAVETTAATEWYPAPLHLKARVRIALGLFLGSCTNIGAAGLLFLHVGSSGRARYAPGAALRNRSGWKSLQNGNACNCTKIGWRLVPVFS